MATYKCAGCDHKCVFKAPIQTRDPWLCPIRGVTVHWDDHVEDYARHDVEQTILIQEKVADDHPAYYGGKDNPYEAIKVIEANGWMEGMCLGNVHKYTVRKGKKTTAEVLDDLGKARHYLDMYIDYVRRTGHE